MKRRDLLLLFALALAFNALLAWPIDQPGTMDSHYYFGGGRNLVQYRAFVEPIIWNYLDAPANLPAPSHLYWMPLPSLLVALAWLLKPTFAAAQVPFVIMASLLPLLAYLTTTHLGGNRRQAWLAGLLVVFSGFFVPFWSLPETFAPFALVGAGALFALGCWLESHRPGWALLAGLAVGLAHLTRADGVLLLGIGLLAAGLGIWRERPAWRAWLVGLALLLLGYLATMGPWLLHTWQVTGSPLATAGAQTIWLRSYDELYSYGTPLTPGRYLAWGWDNILGSKLAAAWSNLQTFVAVDNLIFLTPLTLIGWWQTRRNSFLWPAVLYLAALYAAMTLVFTFPGVRGGLFHSSAALLPALFSLAALGLDTAVNWAARRRPHWNRRTAQVVFSVGAVLLALMLSMVIYSQRVVGNGSWSEPAWNRSDEAMIAVGQWLSEEGPESKPPVVMVGNPPAFNTWTGLPAVVLPNEGIERTLEAARLYQVSYIVLDANRPAPLTALYEGSEQSPELARVWDETSGAPAGLAVYRVLIQP